MNTAMARRLALGDRVIWMGKDDCQPSGTGTITRITAHQVEVLWEDASARRYRRAQLQNLLIETLDSLWKFAWYVCSETGSGYPVEVGPRANSRANLIPYRPGPIRRGLTRNGMHGLG